MNYPDVYIVRFKDKTLNLGDPDLYVAQLINDEYYIAGSEVEYSENEFSLIQKIHIEEGSIRDEDKAIDIANCMETKDTRFRSSEYLITLGKA